MNECQRGWRASGVLVSADSISALVFPLLLPSQNIWASTVRVTLFSIGGRST